MAMQLSWMQVLHWLPAVGQQKCTLSDCLPQILTDIPAKRCSVTFARYSIICCSAFCDVHGDIILHPLALLLQAVG
jgi:hypothetical protein